MNYFWLLLGLALIIISSNILVNAASSIAVKFKIPKSLIALIIVSFGTCIPELAISFNSVANNNGSVALANVIGSCIINIVLIVGIASIVHPIKIKNETVKKELPILLFITSAFSLIILNRLSNKDLFLNRVDGFLLLSAFLIFIYYLVNIIKNKKEDKGNEKPKYTFKKSIIYIVVTLILISISSELLVSNAVSIASDLRISEKIITMVIIIIGTSLPELVMTITAASKNEFELAIGNIIGTNIFNICVVLGLPIVIFGKVNIIDFNKVDILVVFISSLFLYLFSKSSKKISQIEGIFLIFIFIIYYLYIILV